MALLSAKLRLLREDASIPQRKVASFLDIDPATYSKIENGIFAPRKEQILQLADLFNVDDDELLTLWLADKIVAVTGSESKLAREALEIVLKNL